MFIMPSLTWHTRMSMKKAWKPAWQRRLGEHIKAARRAKGYSQAQLGKRLGGLSRETIRLYESGDIAPPLPAMRRIVHLLDGDFEIDGCRISKETLPEQARRAEAHQIPMDFRNEYSYRRATVRVRATPARLTIRVAS